MGIYAKIAQVMARVETIPKSGYNSYHSYPYATETDVLNAIRPLMVEAGLVLIPMAAEAQTSPSAGAEDKGKSGHDVTTVKMRFILADAESGETIEGPWLGQGQDTQDKGVYKAITGGHKYLLMKLFQVPTGDDPERDSPPSKAKKAPKKLPKNAPEEPSQTIRQLRQKVLLKEATLAGLASTHAEMHALEEGFEHLYPEKMREQTKKLAAESTDAERLQKCIHWLEEQIDKAKLTEVVA